MEEQNTPGDNAPEQNTDKQPTSAETGSIFTETEGKKKGGVLKVILTILLGVVLIAGAAGGVWYWQEQQKTAQKSDADARLAELAQQKEDTDKSASDLQKQVDDLSKKQQANSDQINLDSAVVAYISSDGTGDKSFSKAKKAEFNQKVIQPFLSYQKLLGSKIVSILITDKLPEQNNNETRNYWIDVVETTGYAGGWMAGEKGNVELWKAVCGESGPGAAEFGKCPIGYKTFKQKYPNNYTK